MWTQLDVRMPSGDQFNSGRCALEKFWADSDNGSTVALQASGRGSIPRRSTNTTRLAALYSGNVAEGQKLVL